MNRSVEAKHLIRPMREEDLSHVMAIETTVFPDAWTRQGFLDSLASPYSLFLVDILDGEVAGYCGCQQSFEEAEILNVAVHPERRRRGVGRALVHEMIVRAGARGVSRMLLEVRVSNGAAIHLYEKLGFVQIARLKGFYAMPSEDAFLMEYILETSKGTMKGNE